MRLWVVTSVISICAIASAAGPGDKQQRRFGQGRAIEQIHSIVDSLGVTDEQKSKIDDILASTREEGRNLMKDSQNMDPRDRAERFRELLTDARTQIEQQLTPEQKDAFGKKLDEARARFRQGTGAKNGNQQQRARPGQREGRGQGMAMVERLSENLEKLNLSAEQKGQTQKIVAELKSKMQELAANAANDPQTTREQARAAANEAREQIRQVLTREQRAQLRGMMRPPGGPGADQSDMRRSNPDKQPEMNAPPDQKSPATQPTTKPAANAAGRSFLSTGDPAPDFRLRDLGGRFVELSSLGPRMTVLIFGSYTSPHFRRRAAAIDRVATESAVRPNVLVIYTREAHASDQWQIEQNRDENITVPQHKTMEDRLAAAKSAREKLQVKVPMLVDSMDDATLDSYGGQPNAAFVIARGKIVAAQQWFEPYALMRAIERAN